MNRHVVGLIADTHGLLRPGVHAALAGVELILHAGDVGDEEILDELALIAPVRAVRGNTDPSDSPRLPAEVVVTVGGVRIHVSHGHELGAPKPETLLARYAEDVLVYGHTHVARVVRVGRRLVVNPGAAGPARFGEPPSVGRLTIEGNEAAVDLVTLADADP